MPQMSPMDWLILMMYFILVYFLFLINLYFLLKINLNYNKLSFHLTYFFNKWY